MEKSPTGGRQGFDRKLRKCRTGIVLADGVLKLKELQDIYGYLIWSKGKHGQLDSPPCAGFLPSSSMNKVVIGQSWEAENFTRRGPLTCNQMRLLIATRNVLQEVGGLYRECAMWLIGWYVYIYISSCVHLCLWLVGFLIIVIISNYLQKIISVIWLILHVFLPSSYVCMYTYTYTCVTLYYKIR